MPITSLKSHAIRRRSLRKQAADVVKRGGISMTVRFSFDAKFFDGDHEAQQEALTKLKNRAEAVASEPRSINRELNQFRNAVKKIYELIPMSVFSGGRTVRDQWALLNDLDIRVDSYEDAAATLDPKTDAKRPLSGVEMPERSGAKRIRYAYGNDFKNYRYKTHRIHRGCRTSLSFTSETRTALYASAPKKCPRCNGEFDGKKVIRSIDHKIPWSVRRYHAHTIRFCHDGEHFEAVTQKAARKCYNERGNLMVVCVNCNSIKGGKTGGDCIAPTRTGKCEKPETCELTKLTPR